MAANAAAQTPSSSQHDDECSFLPLLSLGADILAGVAGHLGPEASTLRCVSRELCAQRDHSRRHLHIHPGMMQQLLYLERLSTSSSPNRTSSPTASTASSVVAALQKWAHVSTVTAFGQLPDAWVPQLTERAVVAGQLPLLQDLLLHKLTWRHHNPRHAELYVRSVRVQFITQAAQLGAMPAGEATQLMEGVVRKLPLRVPRGSPCSVTGGPSRAPRQANGHGTDGDSSGGEDEEDQEEVFQSVMDVQESDVVEGICQLAALLTNQGHYPLVHRLLALLPLSIDHARALELLVLTQLARGQMDAAANSLLAAPCWAAAAGVAAAVTAAAEAAGREDLAETLRAFVVDGAARRPAELAWWRRHVRCSGAAWLLSGRLDIARVYGVLPAAVDGDRAGDGVEEEEEQGSDSDSEPPKSDTDDDDNNSSNESGAEDEEQEKQEEKQTVPSDPAWARHVVSEHMELVGHLAAGRGADALRLLLRGGGLPGACRDGGDAALAQLHYLLLPSMGLHAFSCGARAERAAHELTAAACTAAAEQGVGAGVRSWAAQPVASLLAWLHHNTGNVEEAAELAQWRRPLHSTAVAGDGAAATAAAAASVIGLPPAGRVVEHACHLLGHSASIWNGGQGEGPMEEELAMVAAGRAPGLPPAYMALPATVELISWLLDASGAGALCDDGQQAITSEMLDAAKDACTACALLAAGGPGPTGDAAAARAAALASQPGLRSEPPMIVYAAALMAAFRHPEAAAQVLTGHAVVGMPSNELQCMVVEVAEALSRAQLHQLHAHRLGLLALGRAADATAPEAVAALLAATSRAAAHTAGELVLALPSDFQWDLKLDYWRQVTLDTVPKAIYSSSAVPAAAAAAAHTSAAPSDTTRPVAGLTDPQLAELVRRPLKAQAELASELAALEPGRRPSLPPQVHEYWPEALLSALVDVCTDQAAPPDACAAMRARMAAVLLDAYKGDEEGLAEVVAENLVLRIEPHLFDLLAVQYGRCDPRVTCFVTQHWATMAAHYLHLRAAHSQAWGLIRLLHVAPPELWLPPLPAPATPPPAGQKLWRALLRSLLEYSTFDSPQPEEDALVAMVGGLVARGAPHAGAVWSSVWDEAAARKRGDVLQAIGTAEDRFRPGGGVC